MSQQQVGVGWEMNEEVPTCIKLCINPMDGALVNMMSPGTLSWLKTNTVCVGNSALGRVWYGECVDTGLTSGFQLVAEMARRSPSAAEQVIAGLGVCICARST